MHQSKLNQLQTLNRFRILQTFEDIERARNKIGHYEIFIYQLVGIDLGFHYPYVKIGDFISPELIKFIDNNLDLICSKREHKLSSNTLKKIALLRESQIPYSISRLEWYRLIILLLLGPKKDNFIVVDNLFPFEVFINEVLIAGNILKTDVTNAAYELATKLWKTKEELMV